MSIDLSTRLVFNAQLTDWELIAQVTLRWTLLALSSLGSMMPRQEIRGQKAFYKYSTVPL